MEGVEETPEAEGPRGWADLDYYAMYCMHMVYDGSGAPWSCAMQWLW